MCATIVAIACTSVTVFVIVCSVPAATLKANQNSHLGLLNLSLSLDSKHYLIMEKVQSSGFARPCSEAATYHKAVGCETTSDMCRKGLTMSDSNAGKSLSSASSNTVTSLIGFISTYNFPQNAFLTIMEAFQDRDHNLVGFSDGEDCLGAGDAAHSYNYGL